MSTALRNSLNEFFRQESLHGQRERVHALERHFRAMENEGKSHVTPKFRNPTKLKSFMESLYFQEKKKREEAVKKWGPPSSSSANKNNPRNRAGDRALNTTHLLQKSESGELYLTRKKQNEVGNEKLF